MASLDQQTIGVFSSGDADVPVVLVRVADPNSGKIWLFSSETLSKVPELYDNLEAHQVESKLPQSLVKNIFLGMPLWQWLALFAAIPVAIAIGWAVVLLLAIPRRLWLKIRHRPNLHAYSRMSKPLLVSFSALAHRVIGATSACRCCHVFITPGPSGLSSASVSSGFCCAPPASRCSACASMPSARAASAPEP